MGNNSSKAQGPSEFQNWNNLPPEIKSECIKFMDIKTRYSLRSTCRIERVLVDSQRFNLYRVRLEGLLPYPINSVITSGFSNVKLTIVPSPYLPEEIRIIHSRNEQRFFNTIVPLLLYILKNSFIEEFSIEHVGGIGWNDILGENLAPESLIITHFQGIMLNQQETLFFLSKLDYETESIHLDANACTTFPIRELIADERILHFDLIQIRDLLYKDAVWEIANKWIEYDVDIGKAFRVTSFNSQTIDSFILKFDDRILYNTGGEIRIRTDNPSKHILLKVAKSWRYKPLILIVIPSELADPDIGILGNWVTKNVISLFEYISFVLTPNDYERDDILMTSFFIMLLQVIWILSSELFKTFILRQ